MNFNNGKQFESFQNSIEIKDSKAEKALTREEILSSDNIELIVKYAKENRDKEAINKVRELLEISRKTGEAVVQNFLNSFKECEKEKNNYSNFEGTASGKLALNLLETMPEPFKARAKEKLEDYKDELGRSADLFKRHKNNSEKIWKEVIGFDYYDIPDFKERFKTFLFKDMAVISDKYYKNSGLAAKLDPFAINFFVEDQKKFDRSYDRDAKHTPLGFSERKKGTDINVININKLKSASEVDNASIHESEHAIDEKTNLLKVRGMGAPDLTEESFDDDKRVVNNEMRSFFLDSLKRAKDEAFAYLKDGTTQASLESRLLNKIKKPLFKEREGENNILDEIRNPNPFYDYNEKLREANYKWIELSKSLAETEKQKLLDAINYLQSEYDRVLKNMVDVIYEKNQSVEFFRNVPINELWKYSNGKYSRTDFIIREFKF